MERIKEFIRREQQQEQPRKKVREMCPKEEEDLSSEEGHRRMIACPTATKYRFERATRVWPLEGKDPRLCWRASDVAMLTSGGEESGMKPGLLVALYFSSENNNGDLSL